MDRVSAWWCTLSKEGFTIRLMMEQCSYPLAHKFCQNLPHLILLSSFTVQGLWDNPYVFHVTKHVDYNKSCNYQLIWNIHVIKLQNIKQSFVHPFTTVMWEVDPANVNGHHKSHSNNVELFLKNIWIVICRENLHIIHLSMYFLSSTLPIIKAFKRWIPLKWGYDKESGWAILILLVSSSSINHIGGGALSYRGVFCGNRGGQSGATLPYPFWPMGITSSCLDQQGMAADKKNAWLKKNPPSHANLDSQVYRFYLNNVVYVLRWSLFLLSIHLINTQHCRWKAQKGFFTQS